MTTDSSQSRGFFTLPELLVATVIAGLLAAFLLTAPRERCNGDRSRSCLSHLKQLGVGMLMYAQDYDDHYPSYHPDSKGDWGAGPWGVDDRSAEHFHSSSLWIAQLLPYTKDPTVFRCPKDANPV